MPQSGRLDPAMLGPYHVPRPVTPWWTDHMDLRRYWNRARVLANPWMLWRTARGLFRARVLGRNSLRVIYLLVTTDCQSRCKMCSVARFRQSGAEVLTPEDYGSIAAQGALFISTLDGAIVCLGAR